MPASGWSAPGWGGTVALYVELSLPSTAAGNALWGSALWNTATWGQDFTWTDVTQWVLGLTTNRGFSRDSAAWTTGTATIEFDNEDLRFSEANASGPYFGRLGAGIPARIRAEITLPGGPVVQLPIFTGVVDDWDEHYDLNGGGVVVVPLVDRFEQIAAFDGFEQTPRGAGELSGSRMHRILDNAGWVWPRDIDRGTVTVQATTLAQNAATEVKLTADSEGGAAWLEADGTFVFRDRYARIEHPQSNTVQATFTDDATGILYEAPIIKSSRDLQRSMAAYARVGGTMQRAVDQTARALIGDRQLSRTDLINTDDPSVLSLAQRDVALRKDAERRVDGLAFRPNFQASAALVTSTWQTLATLRMWQLVKVIRRPLPTLTIDRNVFVTGMSHTISPGDHQWKVGLTFQSATVWQSVASARWDTATWDSAVWVW